LKQPGAANRNGVHGEMRAGKDIEVLEYPMCPGAPSPAWDGWVEVDEGAAGKRADERTTGMRASAAGTSLDDRNDEETRRSFEAGRERGRQEDREAERKAQAAILGESEERRKRELAGVIASFGMERDRFLHAVEQEVVKLALAIAARILRREAEMDPLLLAGAVRVALGQLAESTEVKLRVPAAELEMWKETIGLIPKLAMKPVVIAGDGMRLGDCVVESKVGSVDLGVRSQLGEIERGFMDRQGASPPEAAAQERNAERPEA
jgi:flagellar assembly protein FliH